MWTTYSSFIFITASWHALHAHEYAQFYLCNALGVLSVFNHATLDRPSRLMLVADKTITAVATANGFLRVCQIATQYGSIVPFLIYVPPVLWCHVVYNIKRLSFLPDDAWKPWHVSIHLSMGLFIHIFLFWLSHVRNQPAFHKNDAHRLSASPS